MVRMNHNGARHQHGLAQQLIHVAPPITIRRCFIYLIGRGFTYHDRPTKGCRSFVLLICEFLYEISADRAVTDPAAAGAILNPVQGSLIPRSSAAASTDTIFTRASRVGCHWRLDAAFRGKMIPWVDTLIERCSSSASWPAALE